MTAPLKIRPVTEPVEECHGCKGLGSVECEDCQGDGTRDCECSKCHDVHERDCDACGGEGRYACDVCHGFACLAAARAWESDQVLPLIPWDAVMDEENGVLLVETVPRGDVPVACVEVVRHRGVQLMLDAVNAMPSLLDAVAAAEALRPRDPHRTGHRCACCGREGAPEADGLCPWCSEAHATERERDSLRVALDLRNDTITAMRERATESVAACAAAERARDDAREDLARIGRLVECDSLVGVEIHAAVEHVVRHELDAARDAAERAERERDDARAEVETLRAEAVLLREQLAAATARLEFADAGLKKLADAGWELATDRDRLRAIIAGRTDAPTDAEIAAHYATGGWWRSFRHAYEMDHNGLRFTVGAQSHDYGSAHFVEVDRAQFARDGHVATWWPIDADGRPCAWPVTP